MRWRFGYSKGLIEDKVARLLFIIVDLPHFNTSWAGNPGKRPIDQHWLRWRNQNLNACVETSYVDRWLALGSKSSWLLMLRTAYRLLSRSSPIQSGKASIVSSPSSWAPLSILRNGSIEVFCKEAFVPSNPRMLPKGHFHDFPAISRWFLPSKNDPYAVALHHQYLEQFGDAVVAQECSSFSESYREAANVVSLFRRQELPLSNFLQWAKEGGPDERFRIYLAQTSISALPSRMRDDLPTPDLVSQAGRGDVYDSSIWIGVPPTYTPLHHDPNPNILVQIAGHKTVRLLPPDIGHGVFVEVQRSLGQMNSAKFRGEEMMMGDEGQLMEDLIWMDKRHGNNLASFGFEAHLAQGDGIFIPKGWWHSVKGIGRGITASVSFLHERNLFTLEGLNMVVILDR